MGTADSGSGKVKKPNPRKGVALEPKPAISAGDLRDAVWTLLVMADCYRRRRPYAQPATAKGHDRILTGALETTIQLMCGAARKQREYADQAATLQLKWTVHDAIAVLLKERRPVFRRPVLRTGGDGTHAELLDHARKAGVGSGGAARKAPLGAVPGSAQAPMKVEPTLDKLTGEDATLAAGLARALDEYALRSGVSNNLPKWSAAILKVCNDLHSDPQLEPLAIAENFVSDVTGRVDSTRAKWHASRRTTAGAKGNALHGEQALYFGATDNPADMNWQSRIADLLGGAPFATAAMLGYGPEACLRFTVMAFEHFGGLHDLPSEPALGIRGDPEAWRRIRAAVAEIVEALGGDAREYRRDAGAAGPGAVVRVLGAGGVYGLQDSQPPTPWWFAAMGRPP
jgi:hypothetical protein